MTLAASEDVGHGKVFREPQGVPHGGNVKPTAELQPGGVRCQVNVEQQNVRNALIAFALEVVFCCPQHIVAQVFYQPGHVPRIGKDLTHAGWETSAR